MFRNYSIVFIDIQGKLAQLMHDKDRLFANLQVLAQMANLLDINIIWCRQNPKALGPTIPQLTKYFKGICPIDKFSFSCCDQPEFIDALKATRHAVLCGIESHICVYQTARDLVNMKLDVTVVADAVSSRSLDNKNIALERMRQIGVSVSSVEMLMFELLATAKHPQFRQLAGLIK